VANQGQELRPIHRPTCRQVDALTTISVAATIAACSLINPVRIHGVGFVMFGFHVALAETRATVRGRSHVQSRPGGRLGRPQCPVKRYSRRYRFPVGDSNAGSRRSPSSIARGGATVHHYGGDLDESKSRSNCSALPCSSSRCPTRFGCGRCGFQSGSRSRELLAAHSGQARAVQSGWPELLKQ
jgi:hypothetical protein